jgi:hypothetical protein
VESELVESELVKSELVVFEQQLCVCELVEPEQQPSTSELAEPEQQPPVSERVEVERAPAVGFAAVRPSIVAPAGVGTPPAASTSAGTVTNAWSTSSPQTPLAQHGAGSDTWILFIWMTS